MKKILIILGVATLTGCSAQSAKNAINPFTESGPELGDASNKAILDETQQGGDLDDARHSLKVLGSYERAQEPEPYKPVVRAPVVRLMWVPDHLNPVGDLVPAHYYYLRVKDSDWAVQDAFDNYEQLNKGTSSESSGTPWVYGGVKSGKKGK